MDIFKLFCLPHAGGSAIAYKQWEKYLDKDIKLIPVELAGRGKRSRELFYKNIDNAVEDIYSIIIESQKENCLPYAILGHSMGSLLAYETSLKIQKRREILNPEVVFFSGRDAPHIINDEKEFMNLAEDQQREKIISYGGIPKEILDNKKWYDLFIKIIKADYSMLDNYVYEEKDKIESFAYVLSGTSDEHIKSNLEEWNYVTSKECSIKNFPGGHFFINDNVEKVVNYVNGIIKLKTNMYFERIMIMEISKKLLKIIESITNLENLNESIDLADASVSSIDFIKIIVEIENEFDIEFEDDDLEKEKFTSIDDLAKYVLKKQNLNQQDGSNNG